MESDSEDMENETVNLKRKPSDDLVVDCQRMLGKKKLTDYDLEFLCRDGSLPFYQFLLASHSEYLRNLLGRFHDVEFSIGDWQYGEMFLLDRRKSNQSLSLSVPDFGRDEVKLMLDLLLHGSVSLKNAADARTLKEVWRLFKIDSVSLDALEIISEVNLTDASSTISGPSGNEFSHIKLMNIKKEITEEVEDFIAFQSELEVECDLCKERFQEESDLMRHMDYIHQASNTMYDRIKYKRSREKNSSDHPKNKGKGKGKKSIETKPVRKETHIPEPVTETEDLSGSNSPDDVPPPVDDEPDDVPSPVDVEELMSDNEITFNTNKASEDSRSSVDSSETVRTSLKVSKRISLERKRKFSGDTVEEISSNKKSKDVENDSAVEEEERVTEDDRSLSWEDLNCVYCDQSVPVQKDRPGQNRKKYQTHLLTHFNDTQYQDIPEALRVYRCSYKDCSYCASCKNHYIQHIAFKHDEWFKRINKRIQAAASDPSIAEELEDLSAVKEAFITDQRIIPGKGSAKPLWVEGVTLGREEDNIKDIERPESNSSKTVERPVSVTERTATCNGDTLARNQPEQKEKKVKVDPYLQCHLCTKIMKTDPEQIIKNRHSYQVHLIEAHFEASMYGDIEDREKYFCPRTNCNFPGTEEKSRYRYHLAIHHKEFHQRFFKRIEDLESKSDPSEDEKNYLKKCKKIVAFFNEDSRVVDESIRKEQHILLNLNAPKVAATDEEKKDEVKAKTDIKKEKDMPEIKVEISEDFSKYLKADSIKSEPQDVEAGVVKGDESKPQSEDEAKKSSKPIENNKGKKTKKDLKSRNLRKQPINSEKEEEVIKIEDEVEPTRNESVIESDKSTEDNLGDKEIQKLHEDIINSQPLPITIHDDEEENEPPTKAVESVGEKSKSHPEGESEQTEDAEYECRDCHERFKDRPAIIMHIIAVHMIEKFGEIPSLVGGKFHCPHSKEGCGYTTDKRHGILAHLTLTHSVVKISDVIDYIIHREKQSTATEVEEEVVEPKEKEDIKKEGPSQTLPVQINSGDSADISWKCKACKKSFPTEDVARQHVILDHLIDRFKDLAPVDKKIYVCETCHRYSTVSRQSFIKHLGLNHHVIPEESFSEYIEQSRTLLLDIDVIKCRCDKKFDKQRQLREHIIFTHCKQKFRHVPKGLSLYQCKDHYPSCCFSVESRVTFVKHLVSEHQVLTEKEIKNYFPSSVEEDIVSLGDSSSVESVDNDQSSIGFDDSVSQAANPKGPDPTETPTVIELDEDQIQEEPPFANNSSHSCPVCFKLIAQRSNFEDHLETHGINNEAAFFCSDCDIATSFAQMYHHLSTHHQEHPSSEVRCLPCNEVFTQTASHTCLKLLKDHCVNTISRNGHKSRVAEYFRRPEETLHRIFRYSCQSCSMYFMSSDDLMNHGTIFNSRCLQMNRKTRVHPVFSCHLCNFSKISSLFANHCKGIQHQHKVAEEAALNKTQFGLSSRDQFYVCESCNMASSYENMKAHIEGSSSCAQELLCGLCSLKVLNLDRHVISDSHRKQVTKLKISSQSSERKYFRKFQYLCESCSFSFQTYPELARHSNCPKRKFTCKKCSFSCSSQDFQAHLQSGCDLSLDSGVEIIDDSRPAQSSQSSRPPVASRPGRKSPVGDSIIEISPSEPSVLELEHIPSTSSAGQRKRPRPNPPVRQKVFVYCCDTCKVKFSDGRKIQEHALWHDSQPGTARLTCIVCNWTVNEENVSALLTAHLVTNKHSLQLARKMSAS